MTIKIENIPDGQKIKSINFNIDFESGDSETFVKMPVVERPSTPYEQIIVPMNTTGVNETTPITAVDIEQRAPKEVPNEMLDMEF
jgi:hypothetical protein